FDMMGMEEGKPLAGRDTKRDGVAETTVAADEKTQGIAGELQHVLQEGQAARPGRHLKGCHVRVPPRAGVRGRRTVIAFNVTWHSAESMPLPRHHRAVL